MNIITNKIMEEIQIELIGAHRLELRDETKTIRENIVSAFRSVQNMADKIAENRKEKEFASEYYNEEHTNIISILGDRGSGKSSTLISLKKIIHSASQDDKIEDNHLCLKNCLFLSSLIDPSIIDDCGSILTLIISLLFKEFDQIEKDVSEEKRRSIINRFIDISETIATLDNKNRTNDALDDLLSNAEIYRISIKLQELIDRYLLIKSTVDQKENKINYSYRQLVIVIDDIDLNQKGCYKMLEELRKYFCLTNVIVVISASLNDITRVVASHFDENNKFSKDYIVYKSNDGKVSPDKVYCCNIDMLARKYLDKVLPRPLRIDMEINQDVYIQYVIKKYEEKGIFINNFSKNAKRRFLPDNMRGIIQLVYELKRENDIFQIFLKYFKNYNENSKNIFVKSEVIDLSLFENNGRIIPEKLTLLQQNLEIIFDEFDFNKSLQECLYYYMYFCYIYKMISVSIEAEETKKDSKEVKILSLYNNFFLKNNKILLQNNNLNDKKILSLFSSESSENDIETIAILDLIDWDFDAVENNNLNNNLNHLLSNLIILRIMIHKEEDALNNLKYLSTKYAIDLKRYINFLENSKRTITNINRFAKNTVTEQLSLALKEKIKLSQHVFKSVMKEIYFNDTFKYEKYDELTTEESMVLYNFVLRELKNAKRNNQ